MSVSVTFSGSVAMAPRMRLLRSDLEFPAAEEARRNPARRGGDKTQEVSFYEPQLHCRDSLWPRPKDDFVGISFHAVEYHFGMSIIRPSRIKIGEKSVCANLSLYRSRPFHTFVYISVNGRVRQRGLSLSYVTSGSFTVVMFSFHDRLCFADDHPSRTRNLQDRQNLQV